MVVEWRIRAKRLRFFAYVFLIWIILALFLGLVLVWAADFLVEQGVKTFGEAEIELIGKRNEKALKQLETAATKLETRQDKIIKNMEDLLGGGGTVWHEVKIETTATLLEIQFVNPQTGWVIGTEGTILRTTDGENWSKPEKNLPPADLTHMHFADGNTGWVIGSDGTILQTTDGKNWSPAATDTTALLRHMHFADETNGWVVGDEGVILHTTDGKTWTKTLIDASVDFRRIHFADAKTGWVIGSEGSIFHTTNGITWEKQKTDTKATLLEIHFADAKNGWVIGDEGTMLHTTDGKTWEKIDTYAKAPLFEIQFVDAKTGWVMGGKGTILHTTDGETWTKVDSGTSADLFKMYFADAKRGWIIGKGGTILHTSDGETWKKAVTGTKAPLWGMHFADPFTGWVIGFGGTILHTTDGETWTKADSGTTNILSSLHFVNARTGWVIGFGGTLLATRDYDVTLDGLKIGEQIELARSTPLNALFENKGYLDSLQDIRSALLKNQRNQDLIKSDIEAFRRGGSSGTVPSHPAKEESPSATTGLGAGTDVAFGTFSFQTSIIRITTILLIAFLVQILTGLYRYNTRLAGYYDARADAAMVVEFAGMRFDKLVELLSPDHLAFGRQPKSPADNAVEVGREILRSARARS